MQRRKRLIRHKHSLSNSSHSACPIFFLQWSDAEEKDAEEKEKEEEEVEEAEDEYGDDFDDDGGDFDSS